jgi:hypothetical protein
MAEGDATNGQGDAAVYIAAKRQEPGCRPGGDGKRMVMVGEGRLNLGSNGSTTRTYADRIVG